MPDFKKILLETDNGSVNIALDTIKIEKQALIFVNSKRGAEKLSEDISKKIKEKSSVLGKLGDEILGVLSKPTKQCLRLSKCVMKGTAFHHAGLAQRQREIIEDGFREGIIKVICSTPTLAAGLDLPAYRAVIRDMRRYTPRGLSYIPVLEYLQMAGRAGRPKFDNLGEAIIVCSSEPEKEEAYERYVLGEPEEIYSKLAVEPVLRTYVLSLISSNFAKSKNQLISFFEKTFWAYQFKDLKELEMKILRMIGLLEEWEFIVSSEAEGSLGEDIGSDFTRASEYGKSSLGNDLNLRATLIGKRVAELYIDPLTAHFFIKCARKAKSSGYNSFSFLQMVSHTLEIRPLLRVKTKEYEKIEEKLIVENDSLLEREPSLYDSEYEEFINSIKTAMCLSDWADEKDEEYMIEEYNVRPGELKAKLDTSDWLLFAFFEIVKLLGFKEILNDISKIRVRLKYGVREELLALLKLKNIGRVRARKMFNNKIKNISDVRSVPIDVLVDLLGKKTAVDVKKQVGVEVKKVPERKRKGQISLLDY